VNPESEGHTPVVPGLGTAAKVAVVLLALLLAVDVASLLSGMLDLSIYGRLTADKFVTDDELNGSVTRSGVIGGAQSVMFLLAGIGFIVWFRRAYGSLDRFASGLRRHGLGWAVGGWFVPILNLWRPKQIANDVWRAGRPHEDPPTWPLHAWWAAFIVSGVLGRVAGNIIASADTPAENLSATQLYAVSDLVDIGGLLLAILVVRGITRRLQARAAEPRPAP
jgi:Domain of unknown function (DUF4328)